MIEFTPIKKKYILDNSIVNESQNGTVSGTTVPRKYHRTAGTDESDEKIYEELLQRSRMFAYDEVEEELPCVTIEEPSHQSTVCSVGNISLVAGKAKSRKTFLVTSIVASVLSNDSFLKFNGKLSDDKRRVLYIDTEQSRMDCKKVLMRISAMLNCREDEHPDNLEFIRLRPFPPKLRLGIIEYAINHTPNVGFVIIDGIKDVVFSINDEAEATDVSSRLMKWSEEKKLHIMTVLHKNKTDDNNRGHLGTELENKSETVITVSKDKDNKDISVVESQIMRDREFTPFAFSIGESNVPELADTFSVPARNKDRQPSDFDRQTHLNMLAGIFPGNDNCSARTFYELVKAELQKYGVRIGNNRCRDFLSYYLEEKILTNRGDDKTYKLVLADNQSDSAC